MGNADATRVTRPRPQRVIGPTHPPVQRLRHCGASPVVILDIRRRWRALNDAERLEASEALANFTNDELREMLAEQEAELAGG